MCDVTDRELLEAAARAVGLRVNFHPTASYQWNPLERDDDAFRLAVKLGLMVYVMLEANFTAIRLPGERIGGKYDEVETHGSDPYAATRRAIVRAAAQIGGKQ